MEPNLESDPPSKQRALTNRDRAPSFTEPSPPRPQRKVASAAAAAAAAGPDTDLCCLVHLIQAAFCFAKNGDAEQWLLDGLTSAPEALKATDDSGDSPIGVALMRGALQEGGDFTAAEHLVGLADRHCPSLLDHRSVAKETLLMLSQGVRPAPRALVCTLVLRDPAQVYEKYDIYGKNAIHHCAETANPVALEDLLASLKEAEARSHDFPRFKLAHLTQALEMPDRSGWTPLHYLARDNQAGMLRRLHQFCLNSKLSLNMLPRELNGKRTPYDLAVESGSADARDFLRQFCDEEVEAEDELSDGSGSSDGSSKDLLPFPNDLLHRLKRLSLLTQEELLSQSQQLLEQLQQEKRMDQLLKLRSEFMTVSIDEASFAGNPVRYLVDCLPRDKHSRGKCM